jgi:hypothetical protein
MRQEENPFLTCEDVVSLAWSITKAADAVYFGSVVVTLPADLMVKTVGGQARSCVSPSDFIQSLSIMASVE